MNAPNTSLKPNARLSEATRRNQTWAIDSRVLDVPQRIFVRLILNVSDRRLLSATLTFGIAPIGSELEKLIDRSGKPEQIWLDSGHYPGCDLSLASWSEQHRISIAFQPVEMLHTRSLFDRPYQHLSTFLRDTSYSTLTELGDDIERWRRSYKPAAAPHS